MTMAQSLARDYSLLSPFEKAVLLVQEATGRQRESMCTRLAPKSFQEAFLEESWSYAFTSVAVYAGNKVTLALAAALLALVDEGLAGNEGNIEEFEEHDNVYEERMLLAAGWLVALYRLERETAAPFRAVLQLYGMLWAEDVLQRENLLTESTEHKTQYDTLKELWNMQTERIDPRDKSRKVA